MAAELADTKPPTALALAKSIITASFDDTESDLLETYFAASDVVFSSAESAEGTRAFFAKEVPVFGTGG